ncbi:MAG: FG-GAP-like repeat-containing protein, partial [Phycisphaerae bacterium]
MTYAYGNKTVAVAIALGMMAAACLGPRASAQDCNGNGVSDLLDLLPGPLSFAPAVGYPLAGGAMASAIGSGPLDADGDVDLAVGTAVAAASNVSVLFNAGDGTFGPVSEHIGSVDALSLVVANLDLDDDLDLALGTKSGGSSDAVTVLLNNGLGFFTLDTSFPTLSSRPDAIAAGNFDADDDMDIVTANRNGDSVSVLLNNGNATFATAVVYALPGSRPSDVAIGDIDGDENPDLIVTEKQSDTVAVLLNNGDGTFAAATTLAVGNGPIAVVAADLDQDDDVDLAVLTGGDGFVQVFVNNGFGTLTPWVFAAVEENAADVIATDLDADGDLDLAVANTGLAPGAASVSVLRNNGDATLQARVDFAAGANPTRLTGEDLNGDGLGDLAVLDISGATVYALLNDTALPFSEDCNGNDLPDECDIAAGTSGDCDANGVPDECQPDADGDGVPDICDVCPGFDDAVDTDGDGVPDGCDPCPIDNPDDTDGDGVCDSVDICPGGDDTIDTDGDGVPDFCDACPGGDDNVDTDGDGV